MKHYVPHIIPEKHQVLPDYFRPQNRPEIAPATDPVDWLWWAMAVASALAALFVCSYHAGFGFSLFLLAFFTSPWGRHRIENWLRFYFTSALKAGVLGLLTISCVVTGQQYRQQGVQATEASRLAALAKQKVEQEASRLAVLRLDSLQAHLTKADVLVKKGAYSKSIGLYKQAIRLTTEANGTERHRIWTGLAESYFRSKQHQLAVQQYDALIADGPSNPEYRYRRALCYQKLGRTHEAIADLHGASEAGYKPAAKLYDQLNPLFRKLLYYQTICCDGSDSPSNAKGSGACSHHGGVCNWNKPIYETYRKYDGNGL